MENKVKTNWEIVGELDLDKFDSAKDRMAEYNDTLEKINYFCEVNKIPLPNFQLVPNYVYRNTVTDEVKIGDYINKKGIPDFYSAGRYTHPGDFSLMDADTGKVVFESTDMWEKHTIFINILGGKLSKKLKGTKCYVYHNNYPGYFTNKTISGVMYHEFGHYLQFALAIRYKVYMMLNGKAELNCVYNSKTDLPVMPNRNPKITNYEPDKYESFAETIKLFMTNPDLLKQYNPERYNFLTECLGLKQTISDDWETVLRKNGAHESFIYSARKRIETKTCKHFYMPKAV